MSLSRHMPAGYAVRRAVLTDAFHIGVRMRAIDRAEIEALEGRGIADFLGEAVEGGAWTLTIRDEPVVVYGIVPCRELPGHSLPWLVTNATIDHDDLMTVVRMSQLQVQMWQRRAPVLEALCDSRNDFRRQWLEWLGFEHGGHLGAFGAARLPFDLYVRRRGDAERRPAAKRVH